MLDDLERLQGNEALVRLLSHYAQLGRHDRQIWQDRLMTLEEVAAPELSKLHGELIAFDWIEQNTGNTAGARAGVVPACYRVTLNGLRALRQVQGVAAEEPKEATPIVEAEKPFKGPRRKREKKVAEEQVEVTV